MEKAKQEQMEEFKAQIHIRSLIDGFVDSSVLRCVIELGIADIIQKHGKPISLLATALPLPTVNTDYLERLMKCLVHRGLFIHDKDDNFWLTSCAKYLLRDHNYTLAPIILGFTNDLKGPWQCLSRALEGGPTVFEKYHGINFWEHSASHPETGQEFNETMACDTRLVLPALMQIGGSIFEGISSLVDVGGGNGTAIVEIAKKFPSIKCTVFDLPNVIRNSHKSTGVEWVEGDMFESVPRADAVLLKWILHDWSDEDCLRILQRCKEAIPPGGKVIIIDIVMDIDQEPNLLRQKIKCNIQMMVLLGGKERTKKEWEMLIHTAGYSKCQITSIFALQSVIEAYP